MYYSKLQKFISSLVLFSFLFGITFRVPFFDFKTFAGSSEFYNLVSIIVDEESYNEIKSELKRYSEDIQGVLENTKVIILPTPKNTSAFNIASLNETLYYEGYKSLDKSVDFESKLIGTVLVGDFNLPIVFDNNNSSKTILPFTDFEDKVYIYNHENNRYEKNENNKDGLKSEIWHGVISPNLGDTNKNIDGLKDYFDKNHDFYTGTGNFKYTEGIINGDKQTGVPSNYNPFVFYYDQFREEKSLNYNSFQGYEGYLENKEDILYNRFNKELADKLSEKALGNANEEIGKLLEKVDPTLAGLTNSTGPETENVPDIQTRHIIQNVTKKFIEIFAKGTIGEFRKDVHNAGRYNETGSEVNVDLIPYFVTVLDVVNDEIIKDVNNEIENKIDDLVINGLSRNIAIPTTISNNIGGGVGLFGLCGEIYENYLFGKKASDITNASECSIYRGSTVNGGTLVEANRGLNSTLVEDDVALCQSDFRYTGNVKKATIGYWGGNSPLNLNLSKASEGVIDLDSHDLNGAIKPVFDIGGSKEIFDNTKIYSPLNCLDNNLLLAEKREWGYWDYAEIASCKLIYRIPTFGAREGWICSNDNNLSGRILNFTDSFDDIYKSLSVESCENNSISLNGNIIKNQTHPIFGCPLGEDGEPIYLPGNNYSYKKISSYIIHKSPNAYELKEEIKNMITPSLPIDKDRYIDFISAIGKYVKIDYPVLFRLDLENNTNITFETVSTELEKILKEKSDEINNIINTNKPNSLTGDDLKIYNYLKTGSYPVANFDLVKILKSKEDKTFTVAGESKTLSYYDTLVFAIYWNSLTSVSSKYGFIFDNYLTDQFGSENNTYFLPKNKKQYEIAYIGANGDAQNMYIKLDPEAKADNPYSNISSNNINLSSRLLGSNIGSSKGKDSSLFKCSPPDGVPIWEWIPAVMCRLGEMMPPSISLSDGVCGPSLLSTEEKEEISICNGDVNKNGVNDCIEQKLSDGKLELYSDSEKYYYNKNATLKAIIKDKDGKIVKVANDTDIHFELIKIEEAKDKTKDFSNTNTKIVYDINDEYNSDNSIISDYITFKDLKIKSQGGVAEYGVGLKSLDSNIFLRAYIKINDSSDKEAIFMESELLEIKIRGDKLFNSSYKIENISDEMNIYSGVNSLKVSDKTNIFLVDGTGKNIDFVSNLINNSSISEQKLVIFLDNISTNGNKLPLSYPLDLVLLDGDKELEKLTINESDLTLFKSLFSLKKSGSYTLEITDKQGFKTKKNIELLPEVPNSVDINLGTTVMETGGNISTNFVTLYDKYLNPVSGEFYDVKLEIDGKGLVFLDNDSDKLLTTTFEGYQIFRLKSTNKEGNNKINVSILDKQGEDITSGSKDIKVLENINFIAKPLSSDIKVGGATYKFEISLRNQDGSIINDFNSRVYLTADSIFLESSKPYVELKNGVAEIEFTTKTVAGKNIPIEFQVEGLNKIVKKDITILPGDPMKMDLILSQNKIEASVISYSNLQVELKDRYNNIVFNDNSTNTTLQISNKYKAIIVPDKYSSKVSEGKATYKIYGTINPGVAYFKVSTNPSLTTNSFIIKDESGDIVINGEGENSGKIETFYFWNDSKLEGKKYNSIYTTLLGSNYGDINEQNYLAGSLLFDKNNRALAVTSLLNNNSEYSNILNLNENGGLQTIYSEQDLTQDIEVSTTFIDNKIALNIYNKSLNIYIGKIFYNFDDNNKLVACEGDNNDCIDSKETSIFLKSISDKYNVYLDDNKLILRDIYGKNLLEILEDGTINRFGSVEFEYNKNNTSNYLDINIKTGGNIIANLGFNFINGITNVSREENIFNSKINAVKNGILILLTTNSYGTYNSGNTNNKSKIFYYNDPFSSDSNLNGFTKNNLDGIENFINKPGIGWKEGNKSLLEFAAGKTVGESVADYMSFSVINLGDPVISLKKIKEKLPSTNADRKFDSTIGKLLSKDNDILGYQTFDYDNDSKTDILLLKDNNYLKLLENKDLEGELIDKGNLAHIIDLGNIDLVKTGDFTGDGYEDIFFVNNEGNPYLLNNVTKDFNRYSLINNFDLDGRIVRAEKFDMDNDNIDDVITLDDAGKINIFYGGGSSTKPEFTKLTVSSDNGIKLSSEIRNDNSLVYFDELYQPLKTNGEYFDRLDFERLIYEIDGELIYETDEEFLIRKKKAASSNEQLDKYLFVKYPYSKEEVDINYEEILNGNTELPTEIGSTYFIKSEYSEYNGFRVEKTFKDKNGGFISSGDIVEVEIVLTNVLDNKINNIAYLEKVPEVFELDKNSIYSDKDFEIEAGNMGYHFLIDGFDLSSNETVTITYEAKVKPISYSYLEVGLFEKDEVGDDLYGDIIVKPDNKNCSDTIDIFRSITSRSYNKGTKTPSCDEEKIKLPDELEKNTFDSDGNGVPDYIDKLTNTSNTSILQDYANEQLALMNKDSDNDGIPDSEDSFNMDGRIIIDLGSAGESIDAALDNVQELMDGLSCGFGDASCFASPLNWAPLAPGGDPTFMGIPIGDGLKVGEGLPIVSGLTGINIPTPGGCYQIPAIWPASPFQFTGVCNGSIQAGGSLGITSPTNFFRLFVTPTLTGGVGTAICFGGPAIVAGNSMPMAISPLIPGGNCIVVAKKFGSCGGNGADGDPSSIGIPIYSGNGSFGIINGNCGVEQESIKEPSREDISIYLEEAKKGPVEKAFEFLPGNFSESPIAPLFTQGGGGDISVSLDLSSYEDGNFDDIIQIQMPRISPFPNWLMDWVTRQIEEIVNKLTDFPTVYIILPDFSGIFDGNWGELSGNNEISETDAIKIDNNLTNNNAINSGVKRVNSGIREAYEFIGSTPLVKIEQETVNITLPWLSQAEINKIITDRGNTVSQREEEVLIAKENWKNFDNNIYVETILNLDNLVNSLRQNLEVIKEYKEIPEKINKLINKKEDYLEQILCNIEVISSILGGRIGKNGDRFKSWVELYILIKAILKSWQLIVDVFVDYEEECHECKNERQDALDFEFKLIDAIMPKIPIIRFPKWPDLIIDLHNIRAGLTVLLPEFDVNTKPILLPSLPKLYLPEVPNVDILLNLNLPSLPILPSIEIPELPDIPTLPTVNLPDLPPPPKLPKLLGSIEVVLDIIKLITKAMCILKSSPLHPEWRAGDQIAFLTERNGYLGTDFFSISMPEFSFPFLDAIKVTTYVNLEFETDFIIELARQIAMPINAFSNDFTNIFDVNLGNLDFRNIIPDDVIPSNIEINIGTDGIDSETGFNNLNLLFAKRVSSNITQLVKYIDNTKDDEVNNLEFKKLVNKSLSSKSVTSNPKMDKIREVWNQVNNLTYSKENYLIKELQDSNSEKFEVLSDIINTEIIKNKELKEKIKSVGENPIITKVAFTDSNKIDLYNETLTKYNDKFISTAKKLITPDTSINKELKDSGDKLMSSIKTPLEKFSKGVSEKTSERLITAANTNISTAIDTTATTCQTQSKSEYKYTYKGLYIIEGNTSYRLFDYIDELDGNEETKIIDIDNDNDEDLLYFVNKQLFLKENLEKKESKVYVTTNPIVVNISDNKFYNGDIFYEAINNASEIGNDNGNINLGFSSPTNKNINNFRIQFYNRVDKYLNEKNINYRPEFIKKEIIDAVAAIDDITKIEENDLFIKRKNLSYINNVGNIKGVKLKTNNLINIKDNLSLNQVVNITKGTSLYAGGNGFTIQYQLTGNTKVESLSIAKYENIELQNDIKIIGISADAYIKGNTDIVYEGMQIRDHLYKPLFPGSVISYIGNNYEVTNESYIEIRYYDDSELGIDFDNIVSWELYDLGTKTSDYFVRIDKDNDYYYAKINSFKDNINSTFSRQILLAPQNEADENAPELSMPSIRIPVYQKQIVDITNYIYEDSGIENISRIKVDLDLETDSDGNGNTKDDDDGILEGNYKDKVKVFYSLISIKLEFGIFDSIFKKKIGITLIDENNNFGYSEVNLEVYPPVPQISDYNNGLIKGSINESLTEEPIDLYRFRGGIITKLEDTKGLSKTLTDTGDYIFDVNNTIGTGLNLYKNSKEIAFIDEKTGKINFKDITLTTRVLSSNNKENDSVFPKILIKDTGNDIFYEYISMDGVNKVKYIDSFENLTEKGIYFQFTDKSHYNYYTIPEGLDYNPGALSIYRNTDLNKEELFTIFTDGRINTVNDFYKLEYDSYENYIVLKLIDSHFNREVGKVLFITDSEYIMK